MARHRSHSIEFKRQVAQEFIAGETLHALAKRYDVSPDRVRSFGVRRTADERPSYLKPRRFPPSWSIEESETCYVVRDADGQVAF